MKKVTVSQFKNNLSALLAKAARGEEIIIFDRKVPYVRVVSLFGGAPAPGYDKAEARLTRLEADGFASRRKRDTLAELLSRKRPRAKASVVDALIEERDRDL